MARKTKRLFTIGYEQTPAKAVLDELESAGVKLLVDIGGGLGENVLQLVATWPHLRAGVFDLPSVCALAEKNFDDSPHRPRLATFIGNCFADPLPKGPDAFLLCHFATIWSKEKNLALLRNCHESLPTGGRAIIFNMMQNDSEDGPAGAAMGSPYFLCLATGEGMLYTWREYEEMMRQAGFASVRSHRLPMQHGLIVGTNLPFRDWPTIFPNATCATALIDRVIHHADVIAIEGKSYRLRQAEDRAKAPAKPKKR